MDSVHEPQIPAKKKRRTRPQGSSAKKRTERISQGPSQALLARRIQRGSKKEQMQNFRWLHAQPDISKATQRELKHHFLCSRKNKQDAASTLSEESQALLQRLQDERSAALNGQMKYVTKNDWFKQPVQNNPKVRAEARADPVNDLVLLMNHTSFFKQSKARNRHVRIRERLRSNLKRLERRGAEMEAAGNVRKGNAMEHTKSMMQVTDVMDGMQLERES